MSSILGINITSYPDNCRIPAIPTTSELAARIFRCLVAYASAVPEQLEPFKHMMTDIELGGLGRRQYLLRDGYYGILGFYMCGDEWYVVASRDDESPNTANQIRTANLKLAQLRDEVR